LIAKQCPFVSIALTDYFRYSGMTKEKLDPVTTRLTDIQLRLKELIDPHTIVLGHSLNSDFKALKMTHPFIVDTSIIFPHPRGPPLKASLKWLAKKYLSREIQKNGALGHDSIEDARACLDLVRQKCEKGPKWGTSEATSEPIFKRIGRAPKPSTLKLSTAGDKFRTGAVVDWGDPRRGIGGTADAVVGCDSDEQVVDGIKRALNGDPEDENSNIPVNGVDFVWGCLREVEAMRGWRNAARAHSNGDSVEETSSGGQAVEEKTQDFRSGRLNDSLFKTVAQIADIYAALPPCTAFIVYSGTGDPRELVRLQAQEQQFKKEYETIKWDKLTVQWTDTEQQAIKRACQKARQSIAFVCVK